MVVVPLTKPAMSADAELSTCESGSVTWLTIAAAATLATGGALLVCGKPRAGLVATATGTALAMLDQQETVSVWWNALPQYLAEIQGLLARVQETIDDVSAQRERLHQALAK
jgi:anthranilate phosphoribosyltransferase